MIYIFPRSFCLFCWRKYVDRSWEYINRSQTHECWNWGWGRAIPRKEIHKWDFRCSAGCSIVWPSITSVRTALSDNPSQNALHYVLISHTGVWNRVTTHQTVRGTVWPSITECTELCDHKSHSVRNCVKRVTRPNITQCTELCDHLSHSARNCVTIHHTVRVCTTWPPRTVSGPRIRHEPGHSPILLPAAVVQAYLSCHILPPPPSHPCLSQPGQTQSARPLSLSYLQEWKGWGRRSSYSSSSSSLVYFPKLLPFVEE